MEIIKSPEFLSILKNKHLLLDTNVFIDTSIHPAEFQKLFNELKDNGVTLLTIDAVIIEFVRGAANKDVYHAKRDLINKIIDTTLPTTKNTIPYVYELVEQFRQEGAGASLTDLLLGGLLLEYKKSLLLMTKNSTDFPTNIFKLESFLTLLHKKSIHNYGIYSFVKD